MHALSSSIKDLKSRSACGILPSKPVVLNKCCWMISGLGHTCFQTFLKVELQVTTVGVIRLHVSEHFLR